MKKARKFMESPKGAAVVFGTAAALLAFSTIGGARAAVLYGTQNYPATAGSFAVAFAAASQRELGARYAAALLQLQSENQPVKTF